MVIVTNLAVMVGLPVVLFIVHRLWPEAVESRKTVMLSILALWFLYTFFGSRLIQSGGENIRFVIFSACVVGALGAIMFLIIKNFPGQVRRYDTEFRMGFAATAAAAALAGWRLFG